MDPNHALHADLTCREQQKETMANFVPSITTAESLSLSFVSTFVIVSFTFAQDQGSIISREYSTQLLPKSRENSHSLSRI